MPALARLTTAILLLVLCGAITVARGRADQQPTPSVEPVADTTDRCPPRGSRVVAKNKYLAVYADALDKGTGFLERCARQPPRYVGGLGLAQEPSVSLRGHYLAYTTANCEDPEEPCAVLVHVGIASGGFGAARAATFPRPVVTRTALSRGHDLAWIACRRRGDLGLAYEVPKRCLKGDRSRTVYAASYATLRGDPPGTPVVLDSGGGVQAHSLRIRGRTVSWVRSGRRRSAPLPK